MCKYPGPSTDCANKMFDPNVQLNDAGKQLLLDKHNELRRRVAKGEENNANFPQPGASDMRKLKWNDELATIAQRWTDQCNFGHDDDRNKADGTRVGQNMYIGFNSQQQDETAVNNGLANPVTSWYNEVSDPGFNAADISPFVFSYGAGHYTAVVWAETEEVGCGVTYYEEDNWRKTLVACNYAIGGNMQGGTMYNTDGSPCDNCPAGYTCDDGLCAAP